jgi:hypothetical protein
MCYQLYTNIPYATNILYIFVEIFEALTRSLEPHGVQAALLAVYPRVEHGALKQWTRKSYIVNVKIIHFAISVL